MKLEVLKVEKKLQLLDEDDIINYFRVSNSDLIKELHEQTSQANFLQSCLEILGILGGVAIFIIWALYHKFKETMKINKELNDNV